MFFCEFCGISKNTLFYRTHLVAASIDYGLFTALRRFDTIAMRIILRTFS